MSAEQLLLLQLKVTGEGRRGWERGSPTMPGFKGLNTLLKQRGDAGDFRAAFPVKD